MWLAASVAAFVLGFVGSIPLAGPIAILVVARASEKRFREARLLALGASIAEAAYAGVAFWGFSTLFARSARVVAIAHAMTALLLFGIGIHFVFFHPKAGAPSARGEKTPAAEGALRGFLVAALNPTLLVTWSVVVAALFTHGLRPASGWVAVPFGTAGGLGVLSWFVVLAAVLERHQKQFSKAVLTWIVRGMGVLLVVLGAVSAISVLRHGVDPGS